VPVAVLQQDQSPALLKLFAVGPDLDLHAALKRPENELEGLTDPVGAHGRVEVDVAVLVVDGDLLVPVHQDGDVELRGVLVGKVDLQALRALPGETDPFVQPG
jgi:hypothetical protein